MWNTIWTFSFIISCALSAPFLNCPKTCSCKPFAHHQEVHCSSWNFLQKPLSPKIETSIVKLTVRGKSITSLHSKLRTLRNLKYLDVSSNRIKQFSAAQVPKSVKELDISNNEILYIPTDWSSLPELRKLNITGNPLSCSCDGLWIRDMLVSSHKISISEPVLCNSPKSEFGKSWLKAKCTFDSEFLFGEMQGDEPLEGSGSGDGWTEPIITELPVVNEDAGPIEEEFIRDNKNVVFGQPMSTESTPNEVREEEEGSGSFDFTFEKSSESFTTVVPIHAVTTEKAANDYDEEEDGDDGFEEPTTVVTEERKPNFDFHPGVFSAGCIINCSTPPPLDHSNDTESSSPSGILDEVKIIMDDLFGSTSSSSTTKKPEEPIIEQTEAPQEEVTVAKETVLQTVLTVDKNLYKPSESPNKETEIIDETHSTKEKESAIQSREGKQSNSTFIFLGILLLVMVCLIVYAVVRRAAVKKKSRNRSHVAGLDEKPGEEMKLIKPISVENGKQNGKSETIPLINSQNGAKPFIEDENHQKKEPVTPPGTPADDEDDVELRQKPNDSLLTPETKRVTIRASEIPDSVPKTPILVTRHIDSDGKVVTTPNLNQRSVK